jgi:hypothetical protein
MPINPLLKFHILPFESYIVHTGMLPNVGICKKTISYSDENWSRYLMS